MVDLREGLRGRIEGAVALLSGKKLVGGSKWGGAHLQPPTGFF